MALYKEPIAEIIESIKNTSAVTLVADEYTFGVATAVEQGAGGDNTSMSITAKSAQSSYDGSVNIRYHRRDLADLNTLVPVDIRGYNIQTMLDVATRLNALYGINFTADDIVDGPANLVDGVGSVTLVAKDTSRGWTGSVTINLSLGDRPLSEFLTVSRLPGLSYPSPSTEKPYAAVYSYWRDFTSQSVALETVQTGSGQLSVLNTALNTITGDAWSETVAQRFSLLGANVTFVGAATDNELANTDYDKVIIVELNETNSLGLSGSLVIHYNLS